MLQRSPAIFKLDFKLLVVGDWAINPAWGWRRLNLFVDLCGVRDAYTIKARRQEIDGQG